MNKHNTRLLVYVILMALTVFTACSSPVGEVVYPEADRHRSLTAAEVTADAEYLVRIVEETHPAFLDISEFRDLPSSKYDDAKEFFLKSATNAMTVEDYYLLACGYTAALGDLHTSIDNLSGGGILPTLFNWKEEGLFIIESGENPVQSKKQVTAIGEVKVGDIGAYIDTHMAYENEAGLYYNRSNNVRSKTVLMALGATDGETAVLNIVSNDGAEQVINVDFVTLAEVGTSQESFGYELIENDTVLVITANLCVKDASWEETVNYFRKTVTDLGVRKIIFDIRENTGGDSSVWDPFYPLVNLSETAGDARIGLIRRHSPLAKQSVYKNLTLQGDYARYTPEYYPVLTSGVQIKVLVSERTNSSAVLFLSYAKDILLAEVIGNTPRNNLTHFGNPASFTMPNSHIRGSVSTCLWMRYLPVQDSEGTSANVVDVVVPFGEDAMTYAIERLGQ